jgi:hypothetical protein
MYKWVLLRGSAQGCSPVSRETHNYSHLPAHNWLSFNVNAGTYKNKRIFWHYPTLLGSSPGGDSSKYTEKLKYSHLWAEDKNVGSFFERLFLWIYLENHTKQGCFFFTFWKTTNMVPIAFCSSANVAILFFFKWMLG